MLDEFKSAITSNPQLKVKTLPQAEFLAEQSSMLTSFIERIGVFIAGMMALGALFGALNTMYNAVAARRGRSRRCVRWVSGARTGDSVGDV